MLVPHKDSCKIILPATSTPRSFSVKFLVKFKTFNMYKNIELKKYILIISALFISNFSFSQKASFIKLNLTNEFIENKSFISGFRISTERQITEHSGIETGIWYRHYKVHGSIRSDDLFYNYTLKEDHFSLPVLYKYYSSIIDLSVGPTIDLYGVWSIDKNSSDLKVISEEEEKKSLGIGFLAKASKSIHVSDKFYLEPEIHYNPMLLIKRTFLGFGLSVKYKF